MDLVVNIMTLRAMIQKKLTVFGGEQWRPILAVRDVAGYLVEAVTRNYTGIYNLKYENVIILELAKRIQSVFPEVEIEHTEMSFEDLRNYRVESSKVESDFIFKPKTSVEEQVYRMKVMFGDHRIKNVDDDIYYNTRHVESLIKNGNGEF